MVDADSDYIGLYNESSFDSNVLSAYEVDISNLLTVNSIEPFSGTTITITGNLSLTGNLNGRDPDNFVIGPTSSTDNTLARFDSTTGKLIQGSTLTCDDLGNLTGVGTINGITLTDIVTGPVSSTDNAVARFDSTTGKIIQNSGVTIDDSANIVTSGNLTCTLVNGVSLSVLSSQVSTNTSNIATNTSNIATNTSDIANRVVGPASAADNALARFDLTTGKLVQNSPIICDDSGNLTSVGDITCGLINTINIGILNSQVSTNTSDINILSNDLTTLQTDVDGFPDALKNLTTSEINQLENIGATTISSTQWGWLGGFDQNLRTADTVTFFTVTGFDGNFNIIQPRSGTTTTICGNVFNNSSSAIFCPSSISVDTINEYTSTSGVTIDGVLIKDFNVECTNLKAQTSVQTDSIVEQNVGSGVTIDGVLIKDGLVDGMDCNILKNITASEASQLENIGATTISSTQWGYVGNLNQNLATNSNVSFSSITLATGSSFNRYQEFSNASFTFTCGTQPSSFTTLVRARRIAGLVIVEMAFITGSLSTFFPYSTNPYFGSSSTLDSDFRPDRDIHADCRIRTGGSWQNVSGNYICRSDGTIRIYREPSQSTNFSSGSFTVESFSWSFCK